MNLREYEGKKLFKEYGIPIPNGYLVEDNISRVPSVGDPENNRRALTEVTPREYVLKSQVLSGDRMKAGGIVFASGDKLYPAIDELFKKTVSGEKVTKILVEEKVNVSAEYYVSFSYDTDSRGPVLALSSAGGTGITKAHKFTVDITIGDLPAFWIREKLLGAGFAASDFGLVKIIQNLYELFIKEYALLAEINPVFKVVGQKAGDPPRAEGSFVAGDAKIILDDEKVNPNERRFVNMGGDIAILASGGGASMLNVDALLKYGGRPANYTEYSGNPKSEIVRELTRKVLNQPGIKGLWVVGNKANFTDIYETMRGFIEGLEMVSPKPKYPIVIRRDGPRQKEAAEMLKDFARTKGYNIHVYGSELPMEQSAKILIDLINKNKIPNSKHQNPNNI